MNSGSDSRMEVSAVAIKGLTDREDYFLPRIAKIRLGRKVAGQGAREHPQDCDHFVLDSCPPEVEAVYGKDPKKLVGMFLSDNPEVNFSTALEAWKDPGRAARDRGVDGVLWCRSDGEKARRLLLRGAQGQPLDPQAEAIIARMPEANRPAAGQRFDMACPYQECPVYQDRGCFELARLNFVLPEVTWRGTFQIETKSYWAFQGVGQFFAYLTLVNGGRLRGIPFEISRREQLCNVEGRNVVKYVLHLEIPNEPPKRMLPAPFITLPNLLAAPTEDLPRDHFPAVAAAVDGIADEPRPAARALLEAAAATASGATPQPPPAPKPPEPVQQPLAPATKRRFV